LVSASPGALQHCRRPAIWAIGIRSEAVAGLPMGGFLIEVWAAISDRPLERRNHQFVLG